MAWSRMLNPRTLPSDLVAGLVVFLVALPLCLGVPLASGAPLISGLVAGIVGGLVVGAVSKSHTSVTGSSPGLAAVVAGAITSLGSYETFLAAVVVAGAVQIVLGLARAGSLAAFFPSCVVNGLLAAIGVILILKQIPHLLGHDTDPEGDMAFLQPDRENTFSELLELVGDIDPIAAGIGLAALLFLIAWERVPARYRLIVPGPLVVVVLGTAAAVLLGQWDARWALSPQHLVQVPVASSLGQWVGYLHYPSLDGFLNPAVYTSGLTIALVASLETLLNLNAVDKLDPYQRHSPPSRELVAQGVGNITSGFFGGLPVSSVIVRSSVNINAGGKTRLSTLVHGAFLAVCAVGLPHWLNRIPISCLAAVLLVTGMRLASPVLFQRMWHQGWNQFLPFAATVISIVLTDPLVGVLVGLALSTGFILRSNLRRPVQHYWERHVGGNVLRIELANQVSFLNRAVLSNVLQSLPQGERVLLDATHTDYIDADILDLFREFTERTARARGIQVYLRGFRSEHRMPETPCNLDVVSSELQRSLSPDEVWRLLCEGNARFCAGEMLHRDLNRQVSATANGQFPLAAVLSCMDSRGPVEAIFDLGIGQVFSIRIAGNVVPEKVLGSLEYACAMAGSKLIVVMGHTRCGAVGAALASFRSGQSAREATGCQHLDGVLDEIQQVFGAECDINASTSDESQQRLIDQIAARNVRRGVAAIRECSQVLRQLEEEGRIRIVGAMYDIKSGQVDFLDPPPEPTEEESWVARLEV